MKTLKRAARSCATLVMLLLVGAMLPGFGLAQEVDLDRERLEQFARAHIALNDARDEFHGKVGRIHDEAGRARARAEMDAQVDEILQEQEITRERYDHITLIISLNGEVRAMFEEILLELQEEGTGGPIAAAFAVDFKSASRTRSCGCSSPRGSPGARSSTGTV